MLERIWSELNEGEIHVRDKTQFELKSEFFIHATRNVYKQEFFIFIPESLHITDQTYSKDQFYLDKTNLIRYKTPSITLENLINPNDDQSPLIRINKILKLDVAPNHLHEISDELKLFANIFKVALRDRVHDLLEDIVNITPSTKEAYIKKTTALLNGTLAVCLFFRKLQKKAFDILPDAQIHRHFRYIDEYTSNQLDDYFLILIQAIRQLNDKQLKEIDRSLCQVVLDEKNYRKQANLGPKTSERHPFSAEAVLHRRSVLNRFVLEALTLYNKRISLREKHAPVLGAIAAGIAMLVYMLLFSWKVSGFVITSFPVILFIVFLYILKDRIKEGLKKIYSEQAYRWFPDYSTTITSPKGYDVGAINESFNIIESNELPEGFLSMRNRDFHEELQALHRKESVMQYKREVILYSNNQTIGDRRRELTTIFRFNIQHLLSKANNDYQPHLFLDPYTFEIHQKHLPKVYHLNIIIRNTSLQPNLEIKVEIQKFRVVVDKEGIKRVEQIK